MAPGPLHELLPLMQRAGMSLHPDIMQYSGAEVSANKLQNTQQNAAQIANQIRQFGQEYEAKADLLSYQARNSQLSMTGNALLTALTLGLGTLGQAVLLIPGHGARNAAAALGQVPDKRLNPHLNPQMCRDEFNMQAARQAGGTLKTYALTFKALLKQIRSA